MDYKDYNFNRVPRNRRPPGTSHRQPPHPPEPQQVGGMSPGRYMMTISLISILLSAIILSSVNDMFAFVKKDVDTTITVSQNTTISALSKNLHKHGIINHRFLFIGFLKATGKDTNVLAGDYVLNPDMDYNAIVRTLQSAQGNSTISVTIPEGYTVQQIRSVLLANHVCQSSSELDKALNSHSYSYDFLSGLSVGNNWLEGYLFPDTYQFYVNDSATDVVNRMLANFQKKYDDNIKKGAKTLGLSTRQVVIIASMIEREAKLDSEFAKISGVIHNRMTHSDEFPYLQIDATVQYAVGHKSTLTSKDLEVDSPYNTYKYQGLPPGPIASPGYTSLYAATHPENHNYYYYVAMPDGSHLFAGTLSEHNANIQTANAAFSAQKADKK